MRRNLKNAVSKAVARFRARRAVSRGLFSEFDASALELVSRKFPGHEALKYYERMEHSFVRNAERIFVLRLHRSRGLRILDIGCGFGYFVYAAKQLGHHAVGVDRDDPFYNEVTTMIGVEKVLHTVVPGQPLPEIPGGPFDLITAFATCFDCAGSEGQWGVEEWHDFLEDLRRFMSPGCDLYIKFNQYVGGGARSGRNCQPVPDELLVYFLSLGATFDKRAMWILDVQSALRSLPRSDLQGRRLQSPQAPMSQEA